MIVGGHKTSRGRGTCNRPGVSVAEAPGREGAGQRLLPLDETGGREGDLAAIGSDQFGARVGRGDVADDVDAADAQRVIDISRSFDIDARIIGYTQAADHNELIIESDKGRFEYQ